MIGDGFKLIHTQKVPDLKPVMLEDNPKMEVLYINHGLGILFL